MSEYVEFARKLALHAGEIMQSERGGRLRTAVKPDRSLVTHVDLAINQLVIDAVVREFPAHSVLGEELSYGPTNAEYLWHLDPLDGTGEYVEGEIGVPASYGFALALQKGDDLETGLFFNPSRSEMFIATRGLGTYLNGEKCIISIEEVGFGMSYDYSYWEGALPDLRPLEGKLGAPRGDYSASYQGCMVANGTSAFSVFPGAGSHDIAPSAILVSEAGGIVCDLKGRKHDFRSGLNGAVFSNVATHLPVIELLGFDSGQMET